MTSHEPSKRQAILAVDDNPSSLSVLQRTVSKRYDVRTALSARRALDSCAGMWRPDLILLDVEMPQMDGYALARQFKSDPQMADIPIIFVSGLADEVDEREGFAAGGVDYVTKPFSAALLMARIETQLALKSARDVLAGRAATLEQEVLSRTRIIEEVQEATMVALASLAETRDNETGNHIRRTQLYMERLARALQSRPELNRQLSDEDVALATKSAPLHDIGKIGIPDSILLKPGKLDAKEFERMKTHTTIGNEALVRAESHIASGQGRFLRIAREIAHAHHERWDGTGYPKGLKGEQIPLTARMMAVADVYDAIISKRVYKDRKSHEEAYEYIVNAAGKHFDPAVTEAFIELADEFRAIAARFDDA